MPKNSKAKIKAINKYNKEKTIAFHLSLNKKTDSDIIDILNRKTNKSGYIKSLIRGDNGK